MCVDCTAWYTDCTFPLTGMRGEVLGEWMIAEGRDSWFLSRVVRSVWWDGVVWFGGGMPVGKGLGLQGYMVQLRRESSSSFAVGSFCDGRQSLVKKSVCILR